MPGYLLYVFCIVANVSMLFSVLFYDFVWYFWSLDLHLLMSGLVFVGICTCIFGCIDLYVWVYGLVCWLPGLVFLGVS